MYFISNNSSEDTPKAIFPSDFIYYHHLNNIAGVNYLHRLPPGYIDYILYIGCVKAHRKNYTNIFVNYIGEVILIV